MLEICSFITQEKKGRYFGVLSMGIFLVPSPCPLKRGGGGGIGAETRLAYRLAENAALIKNIIKTIFLLKKNFTKNVNVCLNIL